jgi:hypothetical protein
VPRPLIFGRRQLEHVLRVYIRHFNQQRPHRALDLRPPDRGGRTDSPPTATLYTCGGATSSADSSTNMKPRHDDRVPHATNTITRPDRGIDLCTPDVTGYSPPPIFDTPYLWFTRTREYQIRRVDVKPARFACPAA